MARRDLMIAGAGFVAGSLAAWLATVALGWVPARSPGVDASNADAQQPEPGQARRELETLMAQLGEACADIQRLARHRAWVVDPTTGPCELVPEPSGGHRFAEDLHLVEVAVLDAVLAQPGPLQQLDTPVWELVLGPEALRLTRTDGSVRVHLDVDYTAVELAPWDAKARGEPLTLRPSEGAQVEPPAWFPPFCDADADGVVTLTPIGPGVTNVSFCGHTIPMLVGVSARALTRARWNGERLEELVLQHLPGLPEELRALIQAEGPTAACDLEWIGEDEGAELAAVCRGDEGPSWMRIEGTRWAAGDMTGMKCVDGKGYACATWPEGAPVRLSPSAD